MGEKTLLHSGLAKLEEEGNKVATQVTETNGGRKGSAEDENGQGSNKRRQMEPPYPLKIITDRKSDILPTSKSPTIHTIHYLPLPSRW